MKWYPCHVQSKYCMYRVYWKPIELDLSSISSFQSLVARQLKRWKSSSEKYFFRWKVAVIGSFWGNWFQGCSLSMHRHWELENPPRFNTCFISCSAQTSMFANWYIYVQLSKLHKINVILNTSMQRGAHKIHTMCMDLSIHIFYTLMNYCLAE